MPTPVLSGQVIGQAHFATRALLERRLGDLPFPAWTALNLAGNAPAPLRSDEVVAALVAGLRIGRPAAGSVVDDLAGRGLVRTVRDVVELTPAGRETFERVTAQIARITDALYGDIPEADQEVARRVLDLVRERARALDGADRPA
jgi:DNA-binding MarR family transcriptional regulator